MAALRKHGSATLDKHCCYFRRPDCVLVGGHRDLRSRCITNCPVTAMTVTHCDGRDNTEVRYPPFGMPGYGRAQLATAVHNWMVCAATLMTGTAGQRPILPESVQLVPGRPNESGSAELLCTSPEGSAITLAELVGTSSQRCQDAVDRRQVSALALIVPW